MDALKRAIGPAPTELSEEAFLHKLRTERRRIGESLQAFREATQPQVAKREAKAEMKKKAALLQQLLDRGYTEQEIKDAFGG
jgi:SOS response regulatory protein OraA/RecX